MLIKLYNGLNRFAPGLRLNFRYFSWVPDHTPQPRLSPWRIYSRFFGPSALFFSVSHPPPLRSVSFAAPLFFARKSIDPTGRETRTSGWYRRWNFVRIRERTFVELSDFFTSRHYENPVIGVSYKFISTDVTLRCFSVTNLIICSKYKDNCLFDISSDDWERQLS